MLAKRLHGGAEEQSATPRMWRRASQLPLLGSNQDSPDPESGVLPVTPRGSTASIFHGAEGDRTPDLCSAIAALSQLSYSPRDPSREAVKLVARGSSVNASEDGEGGGDGEDGEVLRNGPVAT